MQRWLLALLPRPPLRQPTSPAPAQPSPTRFIRSGPKPTKPKPAIGLNYQSIGSGGGIKQIIAKTVDFGASDAPLQAEELEKNGLVQFPMVIGGVVPVYNLQGIKPGEIKLTGTVLADIYLGKITKWNAPAIAALNKGVKLPDQDITVVARSDGSGTTFIFTNYLSKVSAEWKEKAGNNTSVKWPAGVAGKGNEGVAAYVQRLAGFDRLCRICLRDPEQDVVRVASEQGRQLRRAR